MRIVLKGLTVALAAVAGASASIGAEPSTSLRLLMPEERMLDDDAAEKIKVTIDCGYITAIDKIPELWNISMGFDLPTVQEFEARVRLGAAAMPKLGGWNGSLRVQISERACFKMTVVVEGRREHTYKWSGKDLRLIP
jgi:hypothetical protein